MEKIRELLGRLGTLNPDELETLKGEVVAEFDRVHGEDTTAENVAILNELAEAGTQILAENQTRADAAAAAETAKAAAAEAMKALRGEDDGEPEGDGKEEPAAEPVADEPAEGEETEEQKAAKAAAAAAEAEPEGEPAAEPVAVTASSSVAALARRGRVQGNPEAALARRGNSPKVILASAFPLEGEINRSALSEVMCDTLGRMLRQGPPRGVALVASAEVQYPENLCLGLDVEQNTAIMEREAGMAAVVASGGVCGPTNVDYDIPTWATAERPLKEGLPAFQATRGGIRFIQPPDIGELGAATAIWTEATDANPGAATKPVFSVQCGQEQLVYVNAVSTRLGFGNMQSRFQPELVAANTDLAIAAAARKAEIKLLELITEKCVKDVTSAKVLGATRDLVTAMQQAAAAFRYSHRIPRSLMLTGIFPEWLKDLIKIDLARESAHQQDNDWNALAISEDQVIGLIKSAGINPIFTLDSLPELAGGTGYPTQQLAVQTANGAINTFPSKLEWKMFPEGTMQFLDGGRLDLGVVRDSTLDATNDYETFVETFEGIADRGFANSALQFVTELCANGQSGATATVATCA